NLHSAQSMDDLNQYISPAGVAAPKAAGAPAGVSRRTIVPLLVLFGTLYFVQGIVEPTACLPAQPLQTQLRSWSYSAGQIGHFFGIIAVAWSLKPLFGLISDFLPIGGRRR